MFMTIYFTIVNKVNKLTRQVKFMKIWKNKYLTNKILYKNIQVNRLKVYLICDHLLQNT